MKVAKHDASRLVLSHRPWDQAVGMIATTLALAALGIFALTFSAAVAWGLLVLALANALLLLWSLRAARAVFDRPHNMLTLTRRTLRGSDVIHLPVSSVSCAELEPAGDAARPVLITAGGVEPLVVAELPLSQAMKIVALVNAWLEVEG